MNKDDHKDDASPAPETVRRPKRGALPSPREVIEGAPPYVPDENDGHAPKHSSTEADTGEENDRDGSNDVKSK
jgi:hypothetical protein